jgi:hypothetical protein
MMIPAAAMSRMRDELSLEGESVVYHPVARQEAFGLPSAPFIIMLASAISGAIMGSLITLIICSLWG